MLFFCNELLITAAAPWVVCSYNELSISDQIFPLNVDFIIGLIPDASIISFLSLANTKRAKTG
jgi:hypothetical protein